MTPEQSEELRARLARGRETLAAKRAAKTTVPAQDDEALLRTLSVDPPVSVAAEAAAERRQRLLGDIDPETAALFSDEELEKIEREERERAAAEQKKQALADVRGVARQRARVEHDLISPSVLRSEADQRRLAEMVTFKITLPGDGAGHNGQNGFRVDGRLYQAGRTYTEPRIVFESLMANHYRTWLNEIEFSTMNQQKPGGSAREVLSRTRPQFEIEHA